MLCVQLLRNDSLRGSYANYGNVFFPAEKSRTSHEDVLKLLSAWEICQGVPGLLESRMASTFPSDMWEYAQMANLCFAAGVSGGCVTSPFCLRTPSHPIAGL